MDRTAMGLFAAGSYEVTPSDRPVSGACPSRADVSTSGQSTWTSAGLDGVRPGSGTHQHADQFALRNGGPSAAYVNPRCRIGDAPRRMSPGFISDAGRCWATVPSAGVHRPAERG